EKIKDRVVSMHASDRFLAPGATLGDLRAGDGAAGYAAVLKHGETGRGLNDYDAIFRILAGAGFGGWISIEDGMDGLDGMARWVAFRKRKRGESFPPQAPRAGELAADGGLRSRRGDLRDDGRLDALARALGATAAAARTLHGAQSAAHARVRDRPGARRGRHD